MNPTKLAQLAQAADQVASEHDDLEAAIAAENEQAAALLTAVVDRIRGSLRALSSRVTSSYRSWWPDTISTADQSTYFDWRGIMVWGDGPQEDHPRANRGAIEGRGIWLCADGAWRLVEYTGHWSRWQGEGDEWESTCAMICEQDVVRMADVNKVIGRLADALDSHLGQRAQPTKRAIERAEKLAAIHKLI